MHGINCDMSQKKPWALKEAGWHTSSHAPVKKLLMADQRIAMLGRVAKVAEGFLVYSTHPTELISGWPRKAKGLGNPFPIASRLQKGDVRQCDVWGQPVQIVLCSEGRPIVPKVRRLALRKAPETPGNDRKQFLVAVETTAAIAELRLRHDE